MTALHHGAIITMDTDEARGAFALISDLLIELPRRSEIMKLFHFSSNRDHTIDAYVLADTKSDARMALIRQSTTDQTLMHNVIAMIREEGYEVTEHDQPGTVIWQQI